MHLVSIVVPVFNRETLVERTLNNLLLQTYPHFEILAVDDASEDKSFQVLQSLAKKEPRIRCFQNQVNLGAQAARNRGIKEARGNWIAFQDSDDLWVPEKLERQMGELEKVNYDPMTVVHSDCTVFYHDRNKKTTWTLPETNGTDAFKTLLQNSNVLFPAILTSKAALERINYLDENVPSFQEWDTAIRLARVCRFIHIHEPLFIYNIHPGDTISKTGERAIAGYRYVVDKFRDEIVQVHGEDSWNGHMRTLVSNALNLGLWNTAEQYLKELQFSGGEVIGLYRAGIYHHLQNRAWIHAQYILNLIGSGENVGALRKLELGILNVLCKLRINPRFLLLLFRKVKGIFIRRRS